MNGHAMQTIDNVPVPPIPPQLAAARAPVNRSQNNSPANGALPIRSATQSSGGMPRHAHSGPYHEHPYPDRAPAFTPSQSSLTDQPLSESPSEEVEHQPEPQPEPEQEPEPEAEPEPEPAPQPTSLQDDPIMPSQIKAKVNFDDNYVTLVVASNILFRSLTDRVDAKLARFTDRSIGNNSVRLRYKDEDGDFVTIDSDEAVQLAFMEWRDQHRESLAKGQVDEIQLFCQAVEN